MEKVEIDMEFDDNVVSFLRALNYISKVYPVTKGDERPGIHALLVPLQNAFTEVKYKWPKTDLTEHTLKALLKKKQIRVYKSSDEFLEDKVEYEKAHTASPKFERMKAGVR